MCVFRKLECRPKEAMLSTLKLWIGWIKIKHTTIVTYQQQSVLQVLVYSSSVVIQGITSLGNHCLLYITFGKKKT